MLSTVQQFITKQHPVSVCSCDFIHASNEHYRGQEQAHKHKKMQYKQASKDTHTLNTYNRQT